MYRTDPSATTPSGTTHSAMFPSDTPSSRRTFLAGSGSAALLALTLGAPRTASAAPLAGTGPVPASAPVLQPVAAEAFDPTALVADYLKQWMFDPNHARHSLYPKSSFAGPASRNVNLKNSRTRKFLQWRKQTFGINLGWTDNAGPQTAAKVARWFFTRSTSDIRPLRYGERIALGYGMDPSFLRYKKRPVGINLAWSEMPEFEWRLLGGPIGQRVSSGQWLAIYNQKAGDCLIHFDRTVGGDIGWPGSQTWTDQLGEILTGAVEKHWKEAVAMLLTMAAA